MPRVPLLLLALSAAACQPTGPGSVSAPADPDSAEVAFSWGGPNEAAMLVPVTINGRGPYDLVLDTGATFTCVDDALAEELELPAVRGQISVGAGVGGAGRMHLARVDSLGVGPARMTDLSVCVLDLAHIRQIGLDVQGLLGLNVLRHFRVGIDFERRTVALHAP